MSGQAPLFTLHWHTDDPAAGSPPESADEADRPSEDTESSPPTTAPTCSEQSVSPSAMEEEPQVEHPLQPCEQATVDLVPRGYQLELFHRACQENIIAFLETGSGKTLVSALLIKKTLEDLEASASEGSVSTAVESTKSSSSASPDKSTSGEASPVTGIPLEDSVFCFAKSSSEAPAANKIAVFLVHRVPLVPQQADVIRSVLKDQGSVGAYYGERGVDDWSSSKWARSLRTQKVLVMTAQIFLNLLRHGLLDIRNVAILVLDEVHHATKNHPYRRLFVEFYHTLSENESRPRVFGMTATPVKAKAASQNEGLCLNAMVALEATLDATVVTVSNESLEEVEELVPRPEEFVITYQRTDPLHRLDESEADAKEFETPAVATVMDIVATDAEEVTVFDIDQEETNLDELDHHEWKLLHFLSTELGVRAASYFGKKICALKGISPDDVISLLQEDASRQQVERGGIQDKVCKLLDILLFEHERCRKQSMNRRVGSASDQFRCIVFVHERVTAVALKWLIEEVFKSFQSSELSARSAVGVQNSDSHVRMTQSKLLQTLDDFRMGKFGILVATNVVEEGLDVAACRLVVAFDTIMTPAAYVQGRGRARKRGARYIAFLEHGSVYDYNSTLKAREGAKLMSMVASGSASTESLRKEHRERIAKDPRTLEKKLFSRTTRAQVSGTEALNLLHRYNVMKAAYHKDEDNLRPVYTTIMLGNGTFTAKVQLHPKVPIDGGVCTVPQEFEVGAKRIAALDAYTKLYQIGEVDEFLLPKRPLRSRRVLRVIHQQNGINPLVQARRKRRRNREVQSKASKKDKRLRECQILHPASVQYIGQKAVTEDSPKDGDENNRPTSEVSEAVEKNESEMDCSSSECDDGDTILMYRLQIDHNLDHLSLVSDHKDLKFGILVKNEVPTEDLKAIRCPSGDELLTLTLQRSIPWSGELQAKAYRYVRSIQLCLRGRSPGSEAAIEIEEREYGKSITTGFLLVPLILEPESCLLNVDWDSIDHFLTFGWRCGPLEQPETARIEKLERSLVCSYHENLNRVYLSGKLNEEVRASSHPNGLLNPAYKSFADYFERKHETALKDSTQVMLQGFSVLDKLSALSTSTFMLPPETCRVIPIPPMACYIASQLPRWQTFLALRSCWKRNRVTLNIDGFLPFARALQPNVNNVSRDGADLSYERLEFLGDAVLKVIYSMAAFVMNPHENEGDLSDERDIEVSNQRLADRALEMKINDCVAFSGVSQKAKAWPWFWATHQNESIQISEKVLADCVEALIGVQYLEGGIELAATFMDRHKLLPGACEVLGIKSQEATLVQSGIEVQLPETFVEDDRKDSAFVLEVEQIIGYKFRDRRHLVIALTHGSYRNGCFTSYQRYEYLGDAIIGFLLLSYFFEKYPTLSPGDLTSLRGPALSNDLFARVIVSLKVHERFWYECPPLRMEIKKFASLVANEEDDNDDVCKTMTVPKVLGDLLESVIGAIVVDKGMRLDGVQEIVLKLMEAELDRFANPERFKNNPVSELVHLVQKAHCTLPQYKYLEESQDLEKICSIVVDGQSIGVGTGPTRRVAKHKAAVEGLKVLREELDRRRLEEEKRQEEKEKEEQGMEQKEGDRQEQGDGEEQELKFQKRQAQGEGQEEELDPEQADDVMECD